MDHVRQSVSGDYEIIVSDTLKIAQVGAESIDPSALPKNLVMK